MSNAEKRAALVALAERVMGWQYWDGWGDAPNGYATLFTDWYGVGIGDTSPPMQGVDVYEHGSEDVTRRFSPLENLADAWMLVEALVKLDWQPTLIVRQFEKYPEDRFGCHGCRLVNTTDESGNITNQRFESFSAKAATMPEAICRAALKATEVRA